MLSEKMQNSEMKFVEFVAIQESECTFVTIIFIETILEILIQNLG